MRVPPTIIKKVAEKQSIKVITEKSEKYSKETQVSASNRRNWRAFEVFLE